ncbi:MAG: hypothetical protein LBT02_03770, partial [Rickettsiales bacterium]|jgi:hypothetical protein|nr:hypothetical protein [Rickettsiales bacterium]
VDDSIFAIPGDGNNMLSLEEIEARIKQYKNKKSKLDVATKNITIAQKKIADEIKAEVEAKKAVKRTDSKQNALKALAGTGMSGDKPITIAPTEATTELLQR